MRKIVAFLLALTMVFALCACGASSGGNVKADVEEVLFEIEDIEHEIYNSGVLSVKYLLKNLSESDFATVELTYQVFDENDNKVSTDTTICLMSLHGDSVWGNLAAPLKEGQAGGYIRFIDAKAYIMEGNNPTGNVEKILSADVVENVFPFGNCTSDSTNGDDGNLSNVTLSVGEKIQTDSVEITLNKLAFQGSVGIGSGVSLAASGDDMILACLSFDIRNISKDTLLVRDFMNVVVDYNDGFIYDTQDKYCYLVEAEDNDPSVLTFKYDRSASGTEFKLSPLQSDKFVLAIPCADVLGEDTTSPLKIIFTLPDGNSTQNYEYVIR